MKIKPLYYKGDETGYKISDTGIVFNKYGKQLAERITPNGYSQLCLRIKRKYKYIYVHRAVYETFVGKIPGCLEINHKDGNKQNNCVDNLEVVSSFENLKHAREMGLNYPHNPHLDDNFERKLLETHSIEDIENICKSLELAEETYKEIANRFKIPIPAVYGIANNKIFVNISKNYDISGRNKRKREMYMKRDLKIKHLWYEGYTAMEIAKILDTTMDAIYRRIYLMRKSGNLSDERKFNDYPRKGCEIQQQE